MIDNASKRPRIPCATPFFAPKDLRTEEQKLQDEIKYLRNCIDDANKIRIRLRNTILTLLISIFILILLYVLK